MFFGNNLSNVCIETLLLIRYLEQKAFELVGREFDLGSHNEVSEILYDVLKLPVPQDGIYFY